MSKIYLVERTDSTQGYDEYDSFVVVAKSPGQARQFCAEEAADEGPNVWLNAQTTLLAKSVIEGEPRIVLGSFNAG